MKSSFPKRDKRKIEVAMPMPSSKVMFWKRALHKYIHTYPYILMWKTVFQNTIYELGIDIANPFFFTGAYRILE